MIFAKTKKKETFMSNIVTIELFFKMKNTKYSHCFLRFKKDEFLKYCMFICKFFDNFFYQGIAKV